MSIDGTRAKSSTGKRNFVVRKLDGAVVTGVVGGLGSLAWIFVPWDRTCDVRVYPVYSSNDERRGATPIKVSRLGAGDGRAHDPAVGRSGSARAGTGRNHEGDRGNRHPGQTPVPGCGIWKS